MNKCDLNKFSPSNYFVFLFFDNIFNDFLKTILYLFYQNCLLPYHFHLHSSILLFLSLFLHLIRNISSTNFIISFVDDSCYSSFPRLFCFLFRDCMKVPLNCSSASFFSDFPFSTNSVSYSNFFESLLDSP